MSDLCLYELEDIVWDDFCQSDDHIVPHPSSERANDHLIQGDSHNKPFHEAASSLNRTGYFIKEREQGISSPSKKRRNTMLEKDTWPDSPCGVFPSSSDSNSIKEASSIASANATSSPHACKSNNVDSNDKELCANDTILGDRTTAVVNTTFSDSVGDISHAGNIPDLFESTEGKDSTELLYYSLPEIGNFVDVDRMFRSCDSTFGFGTSKEDDELSWLTSADNIGGSEHIVKSEFEFPCTEPIPVEFISQNHGSHQENFINDFTMKKDSSWTSEKSDLYMSFVNGPTVANSEDRFILKEQISKNEKQVKLLNQSTGKREEHYFGNCSFNYTSSLPNEHYFGNCSFNYTSSLPNESVQLPLSYMHSNNSPSSNLTSSAPSAVKSESHDLMMSTLQRDSSHSSNQLQNDPRFPVVAPGVTGKREKLNNRQGRRPSAYGGLKNPTALVQVPIVGPESTGKQVQYFGDKSEDHTDAEGVVNLAIPAEFGSAHIQESSTMSSGVDDISQEAASFRQLRLVLEQLDLRTKICIRDSLYRLARSAEQRHNQSYLNRNCGDKRDPSGAFMTAGTNNFMDMETDTNPIDRSIAHLLFHRPSGTRNVVRGPVSSPPVMVENLVVQDETASKIESNRDL